MPPKVLTKNGDRGVLPVSSTARATAKAPAPRLKLEIRRLPPGLTLSEFEEIMGDEWRLGKGKVDWREYRQGKVKLGLGKVPEQSRCYLHVLSEPLVKELEARFLQVAFHDVAGTHKHSDLRNLPPTIGFAPMQRIPISSKIRADNRQGTIDTDPEFIAFLEAETQPTVKAAALDSVNVDKDNVEKVKVTTTPLIDSLREKKAHRAKAAATKDDKKDVKGHARKESKEPVVVAKEGKGKAQQQKVELASKEAAKALNKQVASKQQQPQQPSQQPAAKGAPATGKGKKAAQNAKAQNTPPPQPAPPTAPAAAAAAQTPAPQRQRQRGNNAEGIKKMLEKDLGIKPKGTPAGQKGQNAGTRPGTPATGNAKNKDKDKPSPAPTPPAANTPKVPTGPKQQQQQQHTPPNAAQSSGGVSTIKAYLKHANPSQGMTEILIQQVLSQYGDVANVTIDPRKGTAIAIFKAPEGLKKALAAKKVPVANGSIEMLEFKERGGGGGGGNAAAGAGSGGRGGYRGGRGGGRGGRGGGGQAAAPAKAAAKADAGS